MDDVFKALADASRRKLLDRLFKRDGQTLGELCERVDMTRFGVMKHLRVLEEAGLVVRRRQGREKLHYLNPMPIRLVHDRWVSKYRAPFAAALSELKTTLEEPMTQIYELFIHTTPAKLWEALTDGAVTRKYLFNETLHSDWKPGSEWYSTGPEGKRDVDGKVLECDPPRRLVITWRVLYNPDLSKELSRVTYLIDQRGEMCKLSVTHDVSDAPKTASHVSTNGWQWVISSLKSLLETGQGLPTPQ